MDRPTGTGTAGDSRVVAGRYTLLAPLGSGGMGTVWRARDEVLGREVAVKEVVFPHGLSDDDRDVLRERTRREARAAARLDHPSAVTVFDVVEEGGSPFLVMELVEARTLAEVVRTEGPLSPVRAGQVGLAVLGALTAAHRQGIVHRDVKPGNVLLGRDGRVVLTDFGIATTTGDASITSTGLLLGSPSYIAPERARGQQPGPASDLWSLGATLFTAVEGRPPYDAGDPLATVTAVVTGDHAPFAAAGPLEPVITGLLARDPAERFDAETARVMLEQVARGTDPGPPPAVPSSAPPSAPPSAAARTAERTTAVPVPPEAPRLPSRPVRPTAARRRPDGDGPSRPALVALSLAALFLLATVAAGYLLLTSGGDGQPDGAASPSTSATPTPSASGSASPSGSPTPTPGARPEGVPADWEPYTHPTQGWTLYHPASFAVSDRRGLTQFRDESTRFTLRVDGAVSGTPAEAEQRLDASYAAALGEYRRVRLEPVDFRGAEAAELEFTYADSGASLHALHRAFTAGGRTYTLWWQTNEDAFAGSLATFEQLAAAFVPAP